MQTGNWTPEEEAAVDEQIRNARSALRERLLVHERQRRQREEHEARRRARLRRLSFGLLGGE